MYGWNHFKTITRHKLLVTRYCFRMGLYRQGLAHDLSKYSPTEFREGAKYWEGIRSPHVKERQDKGYSDAWMHHAGRNKHHFEYWIDYGINCDTIIHGVPIPRRYIAEMIADRISASRVYLGKNYTEQEPLKYLNNSLPRLWFVHDQVKEQLSFLLEMLAEKGEKETIYYIKNIFLKEKDK